MPSSFTPIPRPQTTRQRARWLLLGLILSCPLVAVGGEFTVKTPEGALFDARTHFYDVRTRKVVKRARFVGLHGEEKRQAYADVGMQSGPYDLEKWRESREAWKQELATRHHRRFLIAQEKANRRRGITPNEEDDYYAFFRMPDGTRVLLLRTNGISTGAQVDVDNIFNDN